MNAYCLHKEHNAEDVRLKSRPVGRCPKTRLRVIASYQAISMLSKQCLDPGFWASPELMILNQSCPILKTGLFFSSKPCQSTGNRLLLKLTDIKYFQS